MSTRGYENIYFVAPHQFLGDQRPSYNHDVKFTLRLGEVRGYPSAQDLILEGARNSISTNIYAQNNPEPNDQVSFFASVLEWLSPTDHSIKYFWLDLCLIYFATLS